MFMDPVSVKECMQSLKIKNSEGYDRIPQRILVDGLEPLVLAFSGLFARIYAQVQVPNQWLISKTIPVFKNRGDEKDIETTALFQISVQAQKYSKNWSYKEFWKSRNPKALT